MKHPEQIQKIRDVAKAGGKEFGAAQALCEFADFLATLAEESDTQFEKAQATQAKLINLTWGLLGLTVALLVLTGAMLWKMFLP